MKRTDRVGPFASFVTMGGLFLTGLVGVSLPDALPACEAHAGGISPQVAFNVSGPATTGYAGRAGSGTLDLVEFLDGQRLRSFVFPARVKHFGYLGRTGKVRVVHHSEDEHSVYALESEDGNALDVSDVDQRRFADRVVEAFRDLNLNHYLDVGSRGGRISFTIEFEETLVDNDKTLDSLGEILIFERGSHGGNSWMRLQAVTANGEVIGTPLLLNPEEILPTSPPTIVALSGTRAEQMGGTSIDLTRLGVPTLRYLRVTNPGADEVPNGDNGPDLKVLGLKTRR